jgi:hypothetical protein
MVSAKTANWIIKSKDFPEYSVRVGDCARDHARSVYKTLKLDVNTPNDLVLKKERKLLKWLTS